MKSAREPLRLLFVVTGLGSGGAETALLNLCRHMVAIRPDTRIVVLCLIGGDDGPIAAELKRADIKIIALTYARRLGTALRLFNALVELQSFGPHVVQGWMYHGNVVAWWLRNSFFPGARLAGSVHSLWTQPKHVSKVLRVARMLNLIGCWLDVEHTFYAGTASLRQHLDTGFPIRAGSVLPNGVQLEPDGSAVDDEPERTPVPVIAHVSRVHFDKDNENFIRTAAALEARKFRCDILLLGVGLDETFMRRALPGYEQFHYVKVEALGFRTDVRRLLRKSSVVLLSSRSEAFPVSLVEGLGAGAVCVSTDVGDCDAIIDGCGGTVPPRRPDLLAEAVVRWATESHQNRTVWARRCRARAMEHFSLEAMGRIYEGLLSDLGAKAVI